MNRLVTAAVPRLPQVSLRSQVARLVVGVIALLAVLQSATSLKLYRDALEEQLKLKGEAFSHALAADAQLKVGLWAGYTQGIDEQLAAVIERNPALLFVAVKDADKVIAFRGRDAFAAGAVRDRLERKEPVAGAFVTAAAVVDDDTKKAATPGGDDLGLLDTGAAPSSAQAKKDYSVVVGIENASLRAGTIRHLALSLVLGALAVALAILLVGRAFASVFRRMSNVRDVAEVLSTGDLRRSVDDVTGDEIGAVARSVDRIRERWSDIVGDIRGVADEVVRSTREIAAEAARVAEGSQAQAEAAGATAKKSSAIVADAQGLTIIVDAMASTTRQSAESLTLAREASRTVAADMERMLASLHENDGHRGELSRNIASIAEALHELSGAVRSAVLAADDVARRMGGAVDASNGIADHARQAVAQSGEALSLLDKQRTSADAVAAGADETARATAALQEAMGEVLNTTALIRDIADMTSMLSLNASIIAAQAGDRALGFGTVADEIRSLATRTRAAVDGIEQRAAEARKQLEAMGGVVGDLSSTVRASRASTEETTTVLEKVLDQMNGALADVAGLASLIGEASQGTRESRDAVAGIDNEVKSIESALARQRAAQVRLDESSVVMGKNLGGVRETGRQQAVSTDAIIEGMTRLARATEDLVKLSHAQTKSAEGIALETQRVKTVAERHRAHVDAIAAAVGNLDGEARALREALATLQVE